MATLNFDKMSPAAERGTPPDEKAIQVRPSEHRPHALDYLERIAVAVESWQPPGVKRSSGSAVIPGLHGDDRAMLKELTAGMAQMKIELAQIKELLTAQKGEIVKEAYTVEEVAKKTDYAPFTLRQACNKGRIKGAYKGRDHAWRIPHASLLDILTNGLPPE